MIIHISYTTRRIFVYLSSIIHLIVIKRSVIHIKEIFLIKILQYIEEKFVSTCWNSGYKNY